MSPLCSISRPRHISPPWAGAGASHFLLRVSVPAPQSWEQLLQPVQLPQPPSILPLSTLIKTEIFFFRNYNIWFHWTAIFQSLPVQCMDCLLPTLSSRGPDDPGQCSQSVEIKLRAQSVVMMKISKPWLGSRAGARRCQSAGLPD